MLTFIKQPGQPAWGSSRESNLQTYAREPGIITTRQHPSNIHEIFAWSWELTKRHLTCSFVRCCSLMTDAKVRLCDCGSGVFPPVTRKQKKSRQSRDNWEVDVSFCYKLRFLSYRYFFRLSSLHPARKWQPLLNKARKFISLCEMY